LQVSVLFGDVVLVLGVALMAETLSDE